MDQQTYETLKRMQQEGGGFASALADAAMRADSTNLKRLQDAFPDLFARYSPDAR